MQYDSCGVWNESNRNKKRVRVETISGSCANIKCSCLFALIYLNTNLTFNRDKWTKISQAISDIIIIYAVAPKKFFSSVAKNF